MLCLEDANNIIVMYDTIAVMGLSPYDSGEDLLGMG